MLFALLVGELVVKSSQVDGLHGLICSERMVEPGFLWLLYFGNHLLKYYEVRRH